MSLIRYAITVSRLLQTEITSHSLSAVAQQCAPSIGCLQPYMSQRREHDGIPMSALVIASPAAYHGACTADQPHAMNHAQMTAAVCAAASRDRPAKSHLQDASSPAEALGLHHSHAGAEGAALQPADGGVQASDPLRHGCSGSRGADGCLRGPFHHRALYRPCILHAAPCLVSPLACHSHSYHLSTVWQILTGRGPTITVINSGCRMWQCSCRLSQHAAGAG